MKLNDISPPPGAVKKRKRIGCGIGSGHGKTATKGHKGQNARSGGGVPPWFEGGQMPLQRRVPKRGFTNIFKVPYQVVNLDALNRFEAGAKVTRGTLIEAGLVKKASAPVKILGRGELKKSLEIEVDAISRAAAEAVTRAGGSVTLLSGANAFAAAPKPAVEAADGDAKPAEKRESPAAEDEAPSKPENEEQR
jgi:large subunit ribosomal protein L15